MLGRMLSLRSTALLRQCGARTAARTATWSAARTACVSSTDSRISLCTTAGQLAAVAPRATVKPRLHLPSLACCTHSEPTITMTRTSTATEPLEILLQMNELDNRNKNANLLRLVYAFRSQGHRIANIDPLGLTSLENLNDINPERYGLTNLKSPLISQVSLHISQASDANAPHKEATLEDILSHLKNSYCGRIGFEFSHIPIKSERQWFSKHVESYEKRKFTSDEKRYFSSLLTKSEVFDHFMAKKFPQVKRYGLQGAESMMIAMYTLLREASIAGIHDAILCMPHRGRLNLLTDLLTYNPAVFSKVKGNSEAPAELNINADVLSHLAISTKIDVGGPEKIHTANPVALGKARARQMHLYEAHTETDCSIGDRVVCVQLHGDAAFSGQGVVTETLGLANLPFTLQVAQST
ncbi:hypothetical protein BSLG_003428 [Batrachochytrium salamandrivorans]|nr:hypothetical protein BSLG_003428 [Batrachochytrium salamandrivorans]